jgi:hypothetical protein
MHFTVEELRDGWHVVGTRLQAATDQQAVAKVSPRPGMYRTAARLEPERHYFWRGPGGRLEPMS